MSVFLLMRGWVIFFSAKIERDLKLQLNPKYELEKQIENNDTYTKT